MKKINLNWYSVVISLLLIWFIMVLSIWIFRLILNEMKINKAMWDYIKSYAWAESAQELALLDIKKKWYWYYSKIEDNVNNKSVLLSRNFLNKSLYHPKKDVLISHSNDGKVNSYTWNILPLWYDIIPLFFIDDLWEHKVNWISFSILSGDIPSLSWNIVSNDSGISWVWEVWIWIEKKTNLWELGITLDVLVNDFLFSNNTSYLVLFNSWNSWDINYKLTSNNSTEFFTKPRLDILSSWETWDYKQNLKTRVDNTEFLNILKYSIYSN